MADTKSRTTVAGNHSEPKKLRTEPKKGEIPETLRTGPTAVLVPVVLTNPAEPAGERLYPGYTDGDPVLYRGAVWYCDGFMGSNFVRLRDRRKHPSERSGDIPEATIQAVPVLATQPLPDDRKPRKSFQKPKTEKQAAAAARARAGKKSVGDRTAALLDGKDYAAMCKIVESKTGDKGLESRYEHLDSGRRRMVLGNKLRAWLEKHG